MYSRAVGCLKGLIPPQKARSQEGTLYSVDWKPTPFSRIFIRGIHGLRQYRRQRPKGEHVLHCDGSLKGLVIPSLCSLHFVMLITNAKNERSSSEAAFSLNVHSIGWYASR
jgi:hypothetical protein